MNKERQNHLKAHSSSVLLFADQSQNAEFALQHNIEVLQAKLQE